MSFACLRAPSSILLFYSRISRASDRSRVSFVVKRGEIDSTCDQECKQVATMISYSGRKILSFGAPPEEQAEAITFLAYTGRYELSGDKVTHHIEISSIQNYVGKDLVRSVKFQDDQITLLIPPTLVNGKIQTIELVWQRLQSGI